MSKKESNSLPRGVERPVPPPAPPAKRTTISEVEIMTKPLTEGKTRGSMCTKTHGASSLKPIIPPPPVPRKTKMSRREQQWLDFSNRVAEHLREYTVPQYGDEGEDEITNYSVEDCINQISKYTKRYGSQSRSGQQELDFVKIAHYVQCAWEKYNKVMIDDVDETLIASYDKILDLKCIYEGKDDENKTIYIYKGRLK